VAVKPVLWLGSAREDVRSFPRMARRRAGYELFRVQLGLEPSDWRPMSSVGSGVNEIRIHAGTERRVIYAAKFAEAVYVLHAFEKRTRKTPRREIDLARHRLRELVWRRGERLSEESSQWR
jgi:phage-related protein